MCFCFCHAWSVIVLWQLSNEQIYYVVESQYQRLRQSMRPSLSWHTFVSDSGCQFEFDIIILSVATCRYCQSLHVLNCIRVHHLSSSVTTITPSITSSLFHSRLKSQDTPVPQILSTIDPLIPTGLPTGTSTGLPSRTSFQFFSLFQLTRVQDKTGFQLVFITH